MATLGTPAGLAARYTPGVALGSQDAGLQLALDRVEAQIAAYLGFPEATAGSGRTLVSTSYTDYLDGPDCLDSSRILLTPGPVTAITTIHDDPNWTYGSDTLVDSSGYLLDDWGRVWITPTGTHAWSSSPRAIKVVFVAGWTAASEDDPALLDAIYRQTATVISGWRAAGATQIQAGRTSKQLPIPSLRDDVIEALRPYRVRGSWMQ